MSIKKQYLKSRPACKVSFRLPKDEVEFAEKVYIVGEFNNWNKRATPMRSLKNGEFTVTIEVDLNREYQYRYLIDKITWINDPNADKYAPTIYGDTENSVVVV